MCHPRLGAPLGLAPPAAAAQELLASLSGMDWDTIAGFDWGDPTLTGPDLLATATAEGTAGVTAAGLPSAGPAPLLPDWSKLLSLSPSDWAAALQDLHTHQQQQPQPQALPASAPQQQGGGPGPTASGRVYPDAELQQEISLMPPQTQRQQQQAKQQQAPPSPRSEAAAQAQPAPLAGHKRTHSKISPISSGLEGMKLGGSSLT